MAEVLGNESDCEELILYGLEGNNKLNFMYDFSEEEAKFVVV